MSSSETINFSLRQNKAVERSLAFDALKQAQTIVGADSVYVGLGSVWFQDFQMAHRILGVQKMVSIESKQLIHARATFNRPFRNIDVIHGTSAIEVPKLLQSSTYTGSTFIVWLDYDGPLSNERLQELIRLVELMPDNSALLTTFNAQLHAYADDTPQMKEELISLLGPDIVDTDIDESQLKGSNLMATLADCTLNRLKSAAVASGRDGGFVPGIRLLYRDTSNMVTIGGFVPSKAESEACRDMVSDQEWCGVSTDVIATQPLTIREVQALSQLLPSPTSLSRTDVQALGFDLDSKQIAAFQKYYLRYPVYAELR